MVKDSSYEETDSRTELYPEAVAGHDPEGLHQINRASMLRGETPIGVKGKKWRVLSNGEKRPNLNLPSQTDPDRKWIRGSYRIRRLINAKVGVKPF